MKTGINKFSLILLISLLSSCISTRNLTYLSNINTDSNYKTPINNINEPIIQADDLLSITVSSLSPESNMLFNSGVVQNIVPSQIGVSSSLPVDSKTNEGYLVDKSGNINFPVLGIVKVAGLTKLEATEKITNEIKKLVKNPIINIRFLNFRITVIGEVNKPSTFTVPYEKINVLEALGLAGDMTAFGKRENVLIIREKGGLRSATRINFNDKDLLNSPYFYLQQNDIVYVEPVKAKSLQTSTSLSYLPIVSVVVSLLTVMVFAIRR